MLSNIVSGFLINTQSTLCATPVTPDDQTFSVWGIIYTRSLQFYLPGALDAHAKGELHSVNMASEKWLDAFTRGGENIQALATLRDMECHIANLEDNVCKVSNSTSLCVSVAIYHTWIRVATALSYVIQMQYGDRCTNPPRHSKKELISSFEQQVCSFLSSAMDATGNRRRAIVNVWAWAFTGITRKHGESVVDALECSGCVLLMDVREHMAESRLGLVDLLVS